MKNSSKTWVCNCDPICIEDDSPCNVKAKEITNQDLIDKIEKEI